MSIGQDRLDECLTLVKALAPRYQALKDEKDAPHRCERCDYCKATKELAFTGIIDYRDLYKEE